MQSEHRWSSAKVAELRAMLETEIESMVVDDPSCCLLVEGCVFTGLAGCARLMRFLGDVEVAMKLWLKLDVVY